MKKILLLLTLVLFSCSKDDATDEKSSFFPDDSRNFYMGFSTWPYAPTTQAYIDTYQFINGHSDAYEEMMPNKIPWDAWMNNNPLPTEFTAEVYRCVNRRLHGKQLILSVGILNVFRNALAPDYDGTVPAYTDFSDAEIEEAYFKHVKYLVDMLDPEYLIYGVEMNELYVRNQSQWQAYKTLMTNIRQRLKAEYPDLPMAESITLHSLFLSPLADAEAYQNDVFAYVDQMDFVPVSFYPFFNDLNNTSGFQAAFDFLYQHVSKPIAFSETGMNAEDIDVPAYNFQRTGSEETQDEYLQTLLLNAQDHNFEFVIWWTHRDYYQTWLEFPPETQELGKIWLSCGLLRDDGTYRKAYDSWDEVDKLAKKIN